MNAPRFIRVLIVPILAMLAIIPVPRVSAATPRLPDLGMARLADLKLENTTDGRRLLRFSATIVNTGVGAFEIRAQRATTTSPWALQQKVYDDANASSFVGVSNSATLVFGGDGHSHWHVNNLERYELERLDNGSKVGTGAKSGFCFYDNVAYRLTLPRAPQTAVYSSSRGTPIHTCAGGTTATQVVMGLSVGWGDKYGANLPDQYIDITGLTSGRYRLRATADPDNWFQESNTANNFTYVDIQLKGNKISVLGHGPSA